MSEKPRGAKIYQFPSKIEEPTRVVDPGEQREDSGLPSDSEHPIFPPDDPPFDFSNLPDVPPLVDE